MHISLLFCARATPYAGTFEELYFSIIFDKQKQVFKLEDVNIKWSAITCDIEVPGSLDLILATV